MRLWGVGIVISVCLAAPLAAQTSADLVQGLGAALKMDKTLSIMAREAEANAIDIAPDLFAGPPPAQWTDSVALLFEPATARAGFDAGLMSAVTPYNADHLAQAQSFYQSALGVRLLDLELSARSALLDDDIEAAAKQSWADLLADPLPASTQRAALIRDIVAANDLIEANVLAALNGNLAFVQGLAAAGGPTSGLSDEDMLADIRSQEGSLRQDMEDWLYPYLSMAYAPLSDAQLRDYLRFSQTAAGRALNAALFMAFDTLSATQSRGMGLAAGRLMQGQDI